MWSGYVKQHLLKRIFGFELLMAPYAVAHFKLAMQLAGQDLNEGQRQLLAYDFSGSDRVGVYLTNTLEEAERQVSDLFGALRVITEEANAAARIKRVFPILAVIGNPPYAGQSANASWRLERFTVEKMKRTKGGKKRQVVEVREEKVPTFIGRLLKDYFVVDGHPLGERNPKWLHDDYVKFIRWGQWRIERTGAGVLALVTNHSYLDNPTFRGMRQQLMRAFTEIYILDLHGDAQRKETSPDGSADKNVFDIKQGVAIALFVRLPKDEPPLKKVWHSELWGSRAHKYETLFGTDVSNTPWKEIVPQTPDYFFVPHNLVLTDEYEQGLKVTDIFTLSSVGIVTGRDNLAIQWNADQMWQTVSEFAALQEEKARKVYKLGPDAQDWKVKLAQADVNADGPDKKFIRSVLYRPFDSRFTYYTGRSRGFLCRPRSEVMRHLLEHENVALITSRLTKGETFAHVQITRQAAEVICMSPNTSNNGFVFPLYLYPLEEESGQHLLTHSFKWKAGLKGRVPNLNPTAVAKLEQRLKLVFVTEGAGDLVGNFGPEDVLHYVYAVLHSPSYRAKYQEYLKRDFAYVPLPGDVDNFRLLSGIGRKLVSAHLLESSTMSASITHYPVPGDDKVGKKFPKYVLASEDNQGSAASQGRVYINESQFFDDVPDSVWAFMVGGYQVCEKWLRVRRGRVLSYGERVLYQKIVATLAETIALMQEIEQVSTHTG